MAVSDASIETPAIQSRRPQWQRTLARHARSLGAKLGTFILSHPSLRRAANEAYERGGDPFCDLFNRIVSPATFPHPFVWRCTFGGRRLLMPVIPEVRRSWNAALVWRWAGNQSIRRLYERYLAEHVEGVFIDVGANDGTHTYPFALHGYTCLAIEPQLTCVDYIQRVCSLNDFNRVQVIEALVTDELVEKVEMFVSSSTWFSSRLREHTERFEVSRPVQVRTVSLDSTFRERSLRPSLIKIDVEGWEWHALNSATETLRSSGPDLFVEVLRQNPNKRAIWELVSNLGYQCVLVAHYTSTPFHAVSNVDQFLASPGAYSDDYFFSRDRAMIDALLAP